MHRRLDSIDVLRGFDMLFIMGLSPLIAHLCAIFPGGEGCWLARQMGHVAWNGLTHHDTIFPLFLFIAGMTFPFSLAGKRDKGLSDRAIHWSVLRRGAILILLGLVYNGLFDLQFATLRWPSVLGRIGLAWMLAAEIWLAVPKITPKALIAAALLLGYWALHLFLAPDAPEGAVAVSKQGSWAIYLDRMLIPAHLYKPGVYDPEGLTSTLPAIVTALLGMFTGAFLRIPEEQISGGKKTLLMLGAALVLLVAGLAWGQVFPINKKLWTSSFVLVVGAWSVALAALFHYCVDVRRWRKGILFFQVIGLNSITIYMAQRIVPFDRVNAFFFNGAASLLPAPAGTVLLDGTYILLCWAFLYFLYRHKVFLKV